MNDALKRKPEGRESMHMRLPAWLRATVAAIAFLGVVGHDCAAQDADGQKADIAADKNLSFYVSCDALAEEAEFAKGSPELRLHGTPETVPGVIGKALRLSKKQGGLSFLLPKNLGEKQGAISFWMRPVNFEGKKGGRFYLKFFHTSGAGQSIVGQTWYGHGSFRVHYFAHGRSIAVRGLGRPSWERNKWQHVVIAWREEQFAAYVNGQGGLSSNPNIHPSNLGEIVGMGNTGLKTDMYMDPGIKDDNEGDYVFDVDEIRAYDCFLNQEDAEKLFKHKVPDARGSWAWSSTIYPTQNKAIVRGMAPTVREGVDTRFIMSVQPKGSTVQYVDTRLLPEAWEKNDVPCLETLSDGHLNEVSYKVVRIPHDGKWHETVLPLTDLKDGWYDLWVRVYHSRTNAPLYTDCFPFENAPWIGNQLGKEDDYVPSPWTPVKVNGSTVSVWGREIAFTESLLPSSIVSQGEELLAAPGRIEVTVNDETLEIPPAAVRVTRRTPTAVELECVAGAGPLGVKTRHRIEYDGLIWTTLEVIPFNKDCTVDALSVVYDLPKKYGELYSSNQYYDTKERRASPPADGVHGKGDMRSGMPHHVTLGNAERALQVCWDDDRSWTLSPDAAPLMARQLEDKGEIRFNFVAAPLPLHGSWETSFGTIATPTKPRPKGFRRLRVYSDTQPNYLELAEQVGHDPQDYLYELPEGMKRLKGLGSWSWATGFGGLDEKIPLGNLYNDINNVDPRTYGGRYMIAANYALKVNNSGLILDDMVTYGSEWLPHRGSYDNEDYTPGFGNNAHVDVAQNRSFNDFFAWKLDRLLKLSGINYLYFDNLYTKYDTNEAMGAGYRDDNDYLWPTNTIMGLRRILKRSNAVLKRLRPNGVFVGHMSGNNCIAATGFVDVLMPGEEYVYLQNKPPNGHYSEVLSFEMCRANYQPRRWGPAVLMYIVLIRGDKQMVTDELYANTRELIAILGLHDTLLQAHTRRTNHWAIYEFWRAQDRFGWSNPDLDFAGYWMEQCPVYVPDNPMPEKIQASAYTRPGAGAFIVVSNLTKEKEDIQVAIKPDVLKREDNWRAWTAIKPGTVELSNDSFTVAVPPLDYRVVRLGVPTDAETAYSETLSPRE